MKYKNRKLMALGLALLISLATFAPTSRAQQRRRFRADSGVVTLGMGQILRITISSEGFEDGFRARFNWAKYMPAGCNPEGVCRHTVQSRGATALVNVARGEAASFDMQGTGGGVRVEVLADYNGNGIVDAADLMIINTATGETVSHVIMANTTG